MEQILDKVAVADIRAVCKKHFRLPKRDGASRSSIYDALKRQPSNIVDEVRSETLEMLRRGEARYARKRQTSSIHQHRRVKRLRTGQTEDATGDEQDQSSAGEGGGDEQERPTSDIDDAREGVFMTGPDAEEIVAIKKEFLLATGNAAVEHRICGICARNLSAHDLTTLNLNDVPNSIHLFPSTPHPNHDLYDGMLLCPEGVSQDERSLGACKECLTSLKKDKKPPLSLANNLWIGKVPYQLSNLSLAERLMIAKGFPSTYIIKLYPKRKGATNWETSQFHSALKGNVSTYKMNPAQLASVVCEDHLPHSAKLLSATIGVTFIGPKGVKESSMPNTFRVRRWRVREALLWLKANNPLYSDISISEDRLEELPEDGIPDEILLTVRYSGDTRALDQEHDGYVPDYTQEAEYESGFDPSTADLDRWDRGGSSQHGDDETEHESGEEGVDDRTIEPFTFPLQALGVVDVNGEEITSSELMAHALSNSRQTVGASYDENFTIRRGSAFINEYARTDPVTGERNDGGPSDPNHLLGSFPTLFPYGKGGFETKRPINVPYETHARWALQYHDRRFRKDVQFPFQVFGVCQKREVCRSTVLQMKRSYFNRNLEMISTIRPGDLIKASSEESRRVRISSPAIRALRKGLNAVRSNVKGSDKARSQVRSKIWGMTLAFNPPSLWITINPADTQDPIAQVFSGTNIDLDAFCATAGPNATERAVNIATDPFASAKFFHFTIKSVIEILFGIKRSEKGRISRTCGILGTVQGYIGTVEAQGRGTLHIHMLIWLKDAPTSREMQDLLRRPSFRKKAEEYISLVVKADIDQKNTEQIMAIPPALSASYSRPIDPQTTESADLKEAENILARTLQFHTCSTRTCLKLARGRLVCKRRAPFQTAARDWINEVGEWGPKRTSPFLNNWNPSVLSCVRSNNDIKLITNGRLTAKLTFYISSYATKKQQTSSNVSALLAKDLAFHKKNEKRHKDVKDANRRLIQRCANSLTKHREFSAPEVISYLMGWKDTYESHHFTAIFLDSIVKALKDQFSGLTDTRCYSIESRAYKEPSATIQFSQDTVTMKDQIRDYSCRGNGLASTNLLDFIINTYEGEMLSTPGQESANETRRRVGRPRSERHPYLPSANKGSLCRIIRSSGHETVPRIVGSWFPRNDNENEEEIHSAVMLALLVPWRSLTDIKTEERSFKEEYDAMLGTLNKRERSFIDNAQYYHECIDGVKEDKAFSYDSGLHGQNAHYDEDMAQELEQMRTDEHEQPDGLVPQSITEEDIELARQLRSKQNDKLYGEAAIDSAMEYGIFSDTPETITRDVVANVASSQDVDVIAKWEKDLQDYNRTQQARGTGGTGGPGISVEPLTQQSTAGPREEGVVEITTQTSSGQGDERGRTEAANTRPKFRMLNRGQKLAHDIIEERLKQHMSGHAKQLKMLVLGPGGTGKSLLISAITETFRYYGQEHILAKCALTGIAATDIGAQTLHSWAMLPIARSKDDDWIQRSTKDAKSRRRKNVEGKVFLIEDEVSMEDKALSYDASMAVSQIKGEESWANSAFEPYGGMHVIKFGDFHQFPPVKNPTGALYVDRKEDGRKARLGREIFLQFDKVVLLEEQMRTTDSTWANILSKIRVGQCSETDIEEIKRLVLSNKGCDVPDFSVDPWREAILVTPRHTVRERWNEQAVKKHCIESGRRRYIVPAEDFERNSANPLTMEARLAIAKLKDRNTGNLQDSIDLAIGMKAMVKINYATEADIANGTRGRIESLMLDPRERNPTTDKNGDVKLKFPPALILFRPDKPTNIIFEGIAPGLIPITPSSATFTAKNGENTFKLMRRQYAITPGYAFTDYKSQGQTIEYVIIDIGTPPSGTLSAFGVYVALSRSRGRKTIRLLRDFDVTLFQNHPSEELRKDMLRLKRLAEKTEREWLQS